MDELAGRLASLFEPTAQGFVNAIDILLVAYVLYRLLKLLRGTRAWRAVVGIGFFAVALYVSEALNLRTLHWILDKATILAPVVLVLLFLPELRQAIEGFAKVGDFPGRLIANDTASTHKVLREIVEAARMMAKTKTGALIVMERNIRLADVARSGVPVTGQVTRQLLEAMFYGSNPLHDGAVIVRDGEILAAGCRLPLSESTHLGDRYHLRHRAGLGISEQSDAVVLIVSEERGQISIAIDGRLESVVNPERLLERLDLEFAPRETAPSNRRRKRADKDEETDPPKAVNQ